MTFNASMNSQKLYKKYLFQRCLSRKKTAKDYNFLINEIVLNGFQGAVLNLL